MTTPVSEDAPAPTEPAKSEMNGKGKEKGSKRKSEEVVAVSILCLPFQLMLADSYMILLHSERR